MFDFTVGPKDRPKIAQGATLGYGSKTMRLSPERTAHGCVTPAGFDATRRYAFPGLHPGLS